MQKLLVGLLLLLPAGLTAQTWNMSATGGLVYNTITSKPDKFEKAPDRPGAAISLQLGYRRERWEAGLGLSYRCYSVKHEGIILSEPPQPLAFAVNTRERFRTMALSPFLRRHFGKGKMDFYAGLSLGLSIMPFPRDINLWNNGHLDGYSGPSGLLAGVQAGVNYPIAERWALRSEVSIDGLWMKAFSMQSAMITAGVRYTLKRPDAR